MIFFFFFLLVKIEQIEKINLNIALLVRSSDSIICVFQHPKKKKNKHIMLLSQIYKQWKMLNLMGQSHKGVWEQNWPIIKDLSSTTSQS